MLAIKKARKFIENHPSDPASRTLAGLVMALELEQPFELADLYKLNFDKFELGMEILEQWRLDRHYSGKGKLLNAAMQLPQALGQSRMSN